MTNQELRNTIENYFSVQQKQFDAVRKIQEKDLRAKPAADKWSVIECIEHLNLTFAHYIPEINYGFSKMVNHQNTGPKYSVGMFAGMMINGLKPKKDGKIGMKMKTFKITTPGKTLNTREVLDNFQDGFDQLKSFYEKASDWQLKKVKVVSLVGKVLTFKLGDAFLFLLAHQERHFQQMQHVINTLRISTDKTEFV